MNSNCHDAIACINLPANGDTGAASNIPEDQQIYHHASGAGLGMDIVYIYIEDGQHTHVRKNAVQQAGYTARDLYRTGLQNLWKKSVTHLKMHKNGPIRSITTDGHFEASLLLIGELWDKRLATLAENGFMVAIPSRNTLAFCDCKSEEGIQALKDLIKLTHENAEHLLTTSLYQRQDGKWAEIKTDISVTRAETLEQAHARLHEGMLANAEVLRNIAREHFQIELDYDIGGVRWVNQFLENAYKNGSTQDHKNIILFAGAFVGQCIVHSIGGKWDWHGDDYVIRTGDDKLFSPCSKVAKQLACGQDGEDSVLGLYKVIKDMYPPSLSKAQRLLQTLYKRHADYEFHIASVLDQRLQWLRVTGMDGNLVHVQRPTEELGENDEDGAATPASTCFYLHQMRSYYVRSSNGSLVLAEGISESLASLLPDDVRKHIAADKIIRTMYHDAELRQEQSFATIRLQKYQGDSDTDDVYVIGLKNISTEKIRVQQFAHFHFEANQWLLGTSLQTYYPSAEFVDWFELSSAWIKPGQEVTAIGRLGPPHTLWAFMGEAENALPFTASLIVPEEPISVSKRRSDAKRQTSQYYTASLPGNTEMSRALAELQLNFSRNRSGMDAEILNRIAAGKPDWMDQDEPLLEIIHQQKRLLTEGRIVWAALVQANNLLFEEGEHDHPAMLVYSEDPYFESRPHELRAIADKIYQLKSTEPEDPEERLVAASVTNEMNRNMGWQLPDLLTDKKVRAAAFMVFRSHIPNGVLQAVLFPILIHSATDAVMIVPVAFWPLSLTSMWRQGKLVS